MVGVTAILGGYLLNQFWPDTFSGTYNSPLFMFVFCVVFAFGVAYIAYRGVDGTTGVNMAINIIQITALIVFSVIAIAYRMQHPQGSTGYHLSNGVAVNYQVAQEVVKDDKGVPSRCWTRRQARAGSGRQQQADPSMTRVSQRSRCKCRIRRTRTATRFLPTRTASR